MAQKKEKQIESDNLSENPAIGKKAKLLENKIKKLKLELEKKTSKEEPKKKTPAKKEEPKKKTPAKKEEPKKKTPAKKEEPKKKAKAKKEEKKIIEEPKKEEKKTYEEELEEQLSDEEIQNFQIEKMDMEKLTNKVCDIVAKYETDGMLQSELWKKLKLTSRDGSRLALKLER